MYKIIGKLVGLAVSILVFLGVVIGVPRLESFLPSAKAVSGTLNLQGSIASFSGQTTFGQNLPLRPAAGPLRLQYKSDLDTYSDGLILREGDGNVVVGSNVTPGDIAASKLSVMGTINGDKFQDAQNSAYFFDPAATGTSLTTAGNVGIGTTGPTSLLDVRGTLNATTLTLSSATGGTITTSGSYKIHTFTTSGTFTPNGVGNVEVLVVGGGGGGAGSGGAGVGGAGGGAGGYIYNPSVSVTAQAYTITVGGGGGGGAATATGSDGSNSVALGYTATGGGGGGTYSISGRSGGSGGGGGGGSSVGSGTAGQGNDGGPGTAASLYGMGGGGGASSVGGTGGTGTSGGGGSGTANSISGSSVTYAGGGGGGAYGGASPGSGGGAGSGGAGGATGNNPGNPGTANTGGGGGGGSRSSVDQVGGAGGSGVVVIRYRTIPNSIIVNSAGNVGFGTTGPESLVQISGGGLCVGSDTNCNTDNNTEGVVYSSSTAMTTYDLAENYPTKDTTLSPGEVVELDPANGVFVRRSSPDSPYTQKLLGIISTEPGALLGGFNGKQFKEEHQVAVALSGRVPVKIDPDSPSITMGDFLTSSPKPGLAMKATRPGYVVARALEEWKSGGAGTIEAFLQLSYYMGDIDPWGNFRRLEVETLKVNKTLEVGGVNVMDEINDLKRRLDAIEAR